MDLYFAGSSIEIAEQEIKRLECNRLFSNLNDRNDIMEWVEFLRKNPQYKGKFFIDSGAYSAYNLGKTVDVDDYIHFINEIGDVVEIFAQVDHIQDPDMTDAEKEICQQDTWENYLYMIDRLKPEYVDKLIPLYHAGENIKRLHNLLEWTHKDGHHIKYIGLGAPQRAYHNQRRQYFDEWFKIIKSSSNPDVKTHAFGCTDLEALEMFPITSADSTTWLKTAVTGSIIVGKKTFLIGDRSFAKNDNYINRSKALRESIDKYVEDRGFTVEHLKSVDKDRLIFNIRVLKEWQDNYVCKYNPVAEKVQLF